jgi:peptidoglycan/xylan/chitin deacetylase (PgdA/CDA1 family)
MKLFEFIKNEDLLDLFVAKQEYENRKDKYGRFIYKFSNNKDVLRPIVSNYLVDNGFKIEWPENHKFAACLTHDIDSVYPSLKYTLFTMTKLALNLKPQISLRRLVNINKKNNSQNPFWNFKNIIELEESYEAKSSFYFKASLKDPIGWTYDLEALKDEIKHIAEMGWEVGLHGGYYSYNNHELLKKEKDKLEKILGKKVIGIRMHYLRFDTPDTWSLLSDLGFKYDTTFGFPDMPGFRNGMCHPFLPYDIKKNKEIDILEIPLILMDGSLFRMKIEESWKIIKELINNTEKNRGVITILWHNTTFDEIYWNGWSKLYNQILKLLKEKNAWMTSADEVYNHWTKTVNP